jgi:hypothetical protein
MTRRRSIETNNRIEKAIQLRAQGHTYEQIARSCGWAGRQSAQKAIQSELERRVSANVDELRTLQHLALEEIMRRLWSMLYTKTGVVNLRVVDRLIKCLEREAKLYGLDAPPVPRGQGPYTGHAQIVIVEEAETDYQKWLAYKQGHNPLQG